MKRLLLSLLSVAMLLPAESGSIVPVGQVGSKLVSQRPAPTRKKVNKREYINIDILHEALEGAYMHDPACLLIDAHNCEITVLADEEGNVKFIHVRVNPDVDKPRRRATLSNMITVVQEQLNVSEAMRCWKSDDDAAALFSFAPLEQGGGEDLLGVSRCEALQNLLSTFDESTPEMVSVDGFACAFKVVKTGVEMELAVDLSTPIVRYVELRGGKVRGKVKPMEVIEGVFPSLTARPPKGAVSTFGKGASRLRALTTNGQYYLCRNAKAKSKFFAAGEERRLMEAVEREANFKTYGFTVPDFSKAKVDWPDSLNACDLVKKDEETAMPATPPEEQEPQPSKTEPKPDTPAATPEPAAPLTPESARDAYLKMLREM